MCYKVIKLKLYNTCKFLLTRIRIPVLNLPFREYEDSMKYWSDRIESDRVVQIK